MSRRKWLFLACVACGALLFGGGLALASGTTGLLGYQVDYLGTVDNGDSTSTWTYAVTSDGDEPKGLSYWNLAIGSCYEIVQPADGSRYLTSTDATFGCGSTYNCDEAECFVEYGDDPETGTSGIKFDSCWPQLEGNDGTTAHTQIFQVTVTGVPATQADVATGAKAGTPVAAALITGPACGPNAVGLTRFEARSGWLPQVQDEAALVAVALGIGEAWAALRLALR